MVSRLNKQTRCVHVSNPYWITVGFDSMSLSCLAAGIEEQCSWSGARTGKYVSTLAQLTSG